MKRTLPLLLLPVENQVREFDPKLLLASVAAQRGYSSIIGSRREIEYRVASFPPSIFISKDLKTGNGRLFRILQKLGHISVAWDEEVLIHPQSEVYLKNRFSAMALKYVSHLFAWGHNNAELWQKSPDRLAGKPVHITGNPRGDMLRIGIRDYYKNQFEALRHKYGKFILVNTNFSAVNAFTPVQNLIVSTDESSKKVTYGRCARGMASEYAERANRHISAIFDDFKKLIVLLNRTYKDCTIIVRPHPSETPQPYYELSAQCKRVHVTNEGNVIPWLMAAQVLVHNGCTTGIEAYAVGTPAISYRATVDEVVDNQARRVPNLLSHQCFSFEELRSKLDEILAGEVGVLTGSESKALFDHYMTAQDGPLACERILDVFDSILESTSEFPTSTLKDRILGRYHAIRRCIQKQIKSYFPGANLSLSYFRHVYPGISLEELHKKISQFQRVLKCKREIKADQLSKNLFKISP